MKAKRILGAAVCLVLGLFLLILWAARPQVRTHVGNLSFTFVGASNNSAGVILANFKVVNSFSRPVQLGVNEVEVRQANGWPNWIRNSGGTNWFSVGVGSALVVSVPAPTNEGCICRVPFSYIEDQPLREEVRDKARALVGFALSKLAGVPFQGLRRRPWSLEYGPELLCSSNQLALADVARLLAEPDSAPNAAPPHR
jgi:hypothetical protein